MSLDIHHYFNDSTFLSSVFNTAIDGIIVIDSRGRMLKLNESASKLFGYTNEELIGNNVSMLMPEPDHSKHDGYIQNYVQTGIKKIIGIGREVTGLKKMESNFLCDWPLVKLIWMGLFFLQELCMT